MTTTTIRTSLAAGVLILLLAAAIFAVSYSTPRPACIPLASVTDPPMSTPPPSPCLTAVRAVDARYVAGMPDDITTDEGIGVCSLSDLGAAIDVIEPSLTPDATYAQAWGNAQYVCHYSPAMRLCVVNQ